MRNVVIAPVGDNIDALFVGLREFPAQKVILITPPERIKIAQKTKEDLERFKIDAYIEEVEGNLLEGMFEKIAKIKQIEKDTNILVNVATGDRISTCAALSAAFVNGLKAFGVEQNEVMLLPILRFSYYKILTDRKLAILKLLYKSPKTLEKLSKETKMSLPLISYHVNGNLRAEGLKQLGLIETKDVKGRVNVSISTLGNLLIKGYI
ncbi:hypothetical protein CMO88_04710 [Candidatus Woesearchaeota archaeon]|nr:hypothetical protein [Candidatus Woesearchaeota archaeon]|tara:strand:- start:8197 stop:8820 length:624 start_codon:yes stop_codon:yes gene_type:complete